MLHGLSLGGLQNERRRDVDETTSIARIAERYHGADELPRGELDGFFFVAGTPANAVVGREAILRVEVFFTLR